MNERLNILISLLIVLVIPFFRRSLFYRPPWNVRAKKASKRIEFFDVLRGVAIVAVIGIHAVDFYRLELGTETTGLLFTNAFLRFAIPLFIIASGILLDPHDLRNKDARWQFYWRKFIRIFVPYALVTVIWSVVRYGWSPWPPLIHIVRGDISVPYYFIIVLFELYMLYPYIVRFAGHRWFLPVSLGISAGAALADFSYVFGVPLPFEYLFFFAYGISLRPLLVDSRKGKSLPLAPWLGMAVVYFVGFLVAPDYYYNAVYVWGLATFWILYLKQRYLPKVLETSLAYTGRLSLWIFLLHYPVLFWVGRNTPWFGSMPTSIGVLFLVGSAFVLSLSLTAVTTHLIETISKMLRTLVKHS